MLETLVAWLGDYTLRTVFVGSALLGMVTGVLGSFALLRRQSLLGDALSHAALPGICVAFIVTRSKAPLVLILGAGVAAWVGALLIGAVIRMTRIKTDAAMGVAEANRAVVDRVYDALAPYIARIDGRGGGT